MRTRGYEKWNWAGAAGEFWSCSECGASVERATHWHEGKGRRVRQPYNEHQVTCSKRCAHARKIRLQRERREEYRQERARAERWLNEAERRDRAAAAVLGVSLDVSHTELKKAYRRLMLDIHPDRGGDVQRAKAINAAYDHLLARKGWRRV